MGRVRDLWTVPGPSGRRVHGPRWGRGKRWLAIWADPEGRERTRAFDTKDAAELYVSKQSVDVATGAYVDPTRARVTFREYAEAWRQHQRHHRPGTRAQAESRLRVHAYPKIGDRPLGAIRRSDVQDLVSALSDAGLAASTVEVVYVYVSAVFKAAVEDGLLASSPCTRISLPEVVRPRVEPITVEQYRAIIEALPARWKAMAVVGAGTGMRSGELRGLTVDRVTPALHVRGRIRPERAALRIDRQLRSAVGGVPVWGPPKTPAADRTVAIGSVVVGALLEHLEQFALGPGGLVFTTSSRRPVGRGVAGDVWRDATEALKLRPRSGWHDLRHFHASLLIAEGLSPRAVADRLGHEDPAETLRTYAHLWPSDEERSVVATDRALSPSADAEAEQGRNSGA